MAILTTMTENTLENWRKRLIFRSDHRGIKEMDLIMGKFARENVPNFNEAELTSYEELLNESDPDVYSWITGTEQPPANLPSLEILERIKGQYE